MGVDVPRLAEGWPVVVDLEQPAGLTLGNDLTLGDVVEDRRRQSRRAQPKTQDAVVDDVPATDRVHLLDRHTVLGITGPGGLHGERWFSR